MSETSPNGSGHTPPPELTYATVDPFASARTLVRLAGIFNLSVAGVDLLSFLGYLGYAIAFPFILRSGGSTMPATPGAPSPELIAIVMFGAYAVAALVVCIVKVIAGVKLLRRSKHAWVWGIIAAIVGMPQFWCSIFCVVPLAVGIFTLVAMLRGNAKEYLAQEAKRTSATAA